MARSNYDFLNNLITTVYISVSGFVLLQKAILGFPSGSAVKNLLAVQETQEMWVQSRSGRSPRVGNGNQYSCLGNHMDRGAWQAAVHVVTRVRHDLATKPPLPPTVSSCGSSFGFQLFCLRLFVFAVPSFLNILFHLRISSNKPRIIFQALAQILVP